MWHYNFNFSDHETNAGGGNMNELYHYGVKGMKWGVKKVTKENVKEGIKREAKRISDEIDKRQHQKKVERLENSKLPMNRITGKIIRQIDKNKDYAEYKKKLKSAKTTKEKVSVIISNLDKARGPYAPRDPRRSPLPRKPTDRYPWNETPRGPRGRI